MQDLWAFWHSGHIILINVAVLPQNPRPSPFTDRLFFASKVGTVVAHKSD